MNPTLNVPGVDPADIECRTAPDGRQKVMFKTCQVATIDKYGPMFDGNWSHEDRDDCQKVMNACIDHWRATGRLFPEPKEELVKCVCGGNGKIRIDGELVFCSAVPCRLQANTVAQWDTMQAALKAAKK